MIHRVKFIRQGGRYWPGDRVGLPRDEAQHYVDTGRAVWIDPPPNGHDEAPPDEGASTHDMNVSEVRGLVAGLQSIDGLRALRDSEVAHPQYEGGRKGALEAIDEKIEELG